MVWIGCEGNLLLDIELKYDLAMLYINVLRNPASGVVTLSEHVTKGIIRLERQLFILFTKNVIAFSSENILAYCHI